MKRKTELVAALMIGLYGFSGMMAMAAQNDIQESSWEGSAESQTVSGNMGENGGSPEESQRGENTKRSGAVSADKDDSDSGLCSLQIPQKLGIVIDPWEIGGQGQIYSEQYVISNTGDKEGVLTLSFLCKAPEGSDAEIWVDSQGLHDGEGKAIYLEMVFEDGTRIPLSHEGMEYETVLGAGEKLTVSFSGEVNENASQAWKDGDVEVEGVYSWNVAEEVQTETLIEDGTQDDSATGNPKEGTTPDAPHVDDGVQDMQGNGDDSAETGTREDGAEATQECDIGQSEKDDPIEQEG